MHAKPRNQFCTNPITFLNRSPLHAKQLQPLCAIPATFLSRISDMRSIANLFYRRSISDRAMPIGKAKPKFFNRAPHSAQRAEGDRDRRTGVRRLSTRSGGLWGFLRGCKGGDPEPLPRPLKGLFPFVKGDSCTRSIANNSVPLQPAQHH